MILSGPQVSILIFETPSYNDSPISLIKQFICWVGILLSLEKNSLEEKEPIKWDLDGV